MKLNLEKQTYKRLENKLKRLYKNKQGNMFNSMRTSNPKRFIGKFRKYKKKVKNLNEPICRSFKKFDFK